MLFLPFYFYEAIHEVCYFLWEWCELRKKYLKGEVCNIQKKILRKTERLTRILVFLYLLLLLFVQKGVSFWDHLCFKSRFFLDSLLGYKRKRRLI